jgi:hypothetical protein
METFDAILHIGAGKTGSSAIQTFLRENARALNQYGFAVPANDFRFLPQIAGHQVFGFQKFFDAGGVGLFHRLNFMMQAREGRTVILSAENISNGDNYRYFKKFCQEFRTKVIFYIRRQDDYFASAWQQWFGKVHTDIDAWLDGAMKHSAHWGDIIDHWAGMVGGGALLPLVFERQYFHAGDVVQDFAAALGLDDHARQNLKFSQKEINPSFNHVITSLVAGRGDVFENAHDDKFYKFIIDLTGNRYIGGGDISLISRAGRERIIAHYQEENERVRAEYFPDRAALFAPLDHGKYRYADEVDLRGEQLQLLLDVVISAFNAQKET